MKVSLRSNNNTEPFGHNAKVPAYNDDDLMNFGKYKNLKLSEVPASYLHWLWTQKPLSDKRLENYIFNNIHALKQEFPDGIWT
jgi:uncharacterized protein (DUF3820 family)